MATVVCTLHHHIGAETPFERGLNLTCQRDMFEAQIEWLERNYDFIDLDQLFSGRLPKRPLLITFDDAFKSVLDTARNVLAPRGIPSVFFINPGLLGPDALSLDSLMTWANSHVGTAALCDLLGLPPRANLAGIIWQDIVKLGPQGRETIRQRIIASLGRPDVTNRAALLEPSDLPLMKALGIEIGNHTSTHVHCRSLTLEEMQTEIVQARADLERMSGSSVRSFSIPYGNEADLTPAVLRTVRDSGHRGIFLVHARSNHRRPAPDVWYRTSLTSQAPKILSRRLHILPALRTVRHQLGF